VGRRTPRQPQHQSLRHARPGRRVRAGRCRAGRAPPSAAAAKAQPAWGLSTPQQRFDILDAAGSEILARRNELGDLLAREEGKTLPEAIGEVARAGNIFKFFAGEALRVGGEVVPSVRPGSAWKSRASRSAWSA
jgi:acyl-CoA reductase-like NAD-dependent aldehyde dehydrogenase